MAHVQIHAGESIENALRCFKRKVLQEDIIKEAKKHSSYLKLLNAGSLHFLDRGRPYI